MGLIQLLQSMTPQAARETQNSNNNFLNADKISVSQKGVANGVATLNANGKLDQMPTAADVGAVKEETGTWTPVLNFATSGGVTAYSKRTGYYIKHGKLVTLRFFVSPTAKTGSGLLLLAGLPFPVCSLDSDMSVPMSYYAGFTKGGYGLFLTAYTSTSFLFRDWLQNAFNNLGDTQLNVSNMYLAGEFTYETT